MTVLEVQRWETNSELIEAAFRMHVFPKNWATDDVRVLDATFGRGVWWQWISSGLIVRPDDTNLCCAGRSEHPYMVVRGHDIRVSGVDYRELPYPDDHWDVVAFDPDYVAPGGRKTSTIENFNDRYGLKDVYESPASLQKSIDQGVVEAARVVKPQGIVMVKCMNYISSGKPWLGEKRTLNAIEAAGLLVEDIFVHLGDPGPQPEHKIQKHARSNSSRLIVARKPGRRKKA